MFSFFTSKKSKPAPPAVAARQEHVFVSTPEDVTIRNRMEEFIERAESEYARLSKEIDDLMDAERVYGHVSTGNKEKRAQLHGQMTAIHHSIAIIKGTDSIVEGFRLDKMAQSRVNDRFPLNSFLSQSSLMYPQRLPMM